MNKIYTPYDLESFEPTHPGELLADELEARGLSQRRFAEMIGISCSVLNEVIRGNAPSRLNWHLKSKPLRERRLIFGSNSKPNITIGQPRKTKNSPFCWTRYARRLPYFRKVFRYTSLQNRKANE